MAQGRRSVLRLKFAKGVDHAVEFESSQVIEGWMDQHRSFFQGKCWVRADCTRSDSDWVQSKTGETLGMLRVAFNRVNPIERNPP